MKFTRSGLPALTTREQEILDRIWAGLSSPDIAKQLKISHKTVSAHRASIFGKFRVSNVQSLLRLAVTHKLVKV